MKKDDKTNSITERNPIVQRKNPWPHRIFIFVLILLGIAIVFSAIFFPINSYLSRKVSIKMVKEAWSEYNYEKVYDLSKQFLEENPYNNTVLTYYSYACFFLSQSQTENQQSQEYLNECINNLRIAIYDASKELLPQLYYMLGRAYFYKSSFSAHYYADLAIKYLLLARNENYDAVDIPEYLGLSYASLGMTKESISSFTEALLVRESDSLLLSIAEQYHKLGENNAAKQYLYRITQNSKNDEVIVSSLLLLANIYLEEKNYEEAEIEFNQVLEKNPDSADAYFGLGLILEQQGNIVKARAQWRQARKIQPNHSGVLQKLSEY